LQRADVDIAHNAVEVEPIDLAPLQRAVARLEVK